MKTFIFAIHILKIHETCSGSPLHFLFPFSSLPTLLFSPPQWELVKPFWFGNTRRMEESLNGLRDPHQGLCNAEKWSFPNDKGIANCPWKSNGNLKTSGCISWNLPVFMVLSFTIMIYNCFVIDLFCVKGCVTSDLVQIIMLIRFRFGSTHTDWDPSDMDFYTDNVNVWDRRTACKKRYESESVYASESDFGWSRKVLLDHPHQQSKYFGWSRKVFQDRLQYVFS